MFLVFFRTLEMVPAKALLYQICKRFWPSYKKYCNIHQSDEINDGTKKIASTEK